MKKENEMILNISNHSIKFTYKMTGTHVETKTTMWEVYADGNYVGLVMKAAGGWEGLTGEVCGDEKPKYVTYCTGPRKYAAEHLAHLAGLLDSNYNDINKETSK